MTGFPLLEQRLQRIWYDRAPVPWWLAALVPAYRTLAAARRLPYALGLRQPARFAAPVIVVGNLVVGGSGKTPLVIALVQALRARGWHPGVVSRGYGGSERGPFLLDAQARPAQVGDEPCLIRQRTGAPLVVGRDRARAIALLLAQGVDVVIADDGLQNPGFARDVQIGVVDGRRRFGNARLLPAGPLREPASRWAALDFRVCNGGTAQPGETHMQLRGELAVSLDDPAQTRALDSLAGTRVHAVAAIGDPSRFFDALRARGIEVMAHAFADHHAFAPADLQFGDALPVLMTEKDAVKCAAFAQPNFACVPVHAELPEAWFDAVAARLRAGKGT